MIMMNNKYKGRSTLLIDKAKEVFNKYIWPNKGLFLTLLLIIITGVFKHWYSRSSGHSIPNKDTIKATETTDKVTSTGTITVTPNKEPNDVLVVHESLVASNGHRKVEVPIKSIKAPITVDNPSNNPDTPNNNNKTVTYENKIDVSALVRPLVPKWEIGTGVGTHRGNVYVPVSVQRDYKVDKAVRVEVHLDPKDRMAPKGVEVQHIWKF